MKNYKPSLEFDKKYGTKTFQKYKFPENKTAFQVWNMGGKEIRDLSKKLTADHFSWLPFAHTQPYQNYPFSIKVGISAKREILYGMASGFNESDIYSFAILLRRASDLEHIRIQSVLFSRLKEMYDVSFAQQVVRDIHWVISMPTAIHIIENLKKPRNYKI